MKTVVQAKTVAHKSAIDLPRVGALVAIGASGTPIVDYEGNESGPLPARTAIISANRGDTVILLFDRGDPSCPIIIGVVHDRLEPNVPEELTITAKRVILKGTEEVNLRCGESSLLLRKDGKTLLKGREVVSRASQTNRIKGSTVQVN